MCILKSTFENAILYLYTFYFIDTDLIVMIE